LVWNFLLRDSKSALHFFGQEASNTSYSEAEPNPLPEWLPDKLWHEILRVSSELEPFKNLSDHVKNNSDKWIKFYDTTRPQDEDFPDSWNELR